MAFSIHFLICNIIVGILLGIILFFKKILKKHVTADVQYYIWYIFAAALILPFAPYTPFEPGRLLSKIRDLFTPAASLSTGIPARQSVDMTAPAQLGLSDLAASFSGTSFRTLGVILTVIWAAGCFVTAGFFLYQIFKIRRIRKAAYLITAENEPELYSCCLSCTQELKIGQQVSLYASCVLTSPVSYGLFRPKVIIPQDMDIVLGADDVRFIFLHELQHLKHRDAALNYISCVLQIIYWFNPLVWYGFRIMQKDREIACDHSVIRTVGRERAVSYGHTLIRYAEKLHRNAFLSPLSSLGGEKSVIVQRVKEIADYKAETPARRFKSFCTLSLAVILVYTASPFLTAYAAENSPYELSGRNVEEIDLSSYFHGNDGAFVLYDMTEDSYLIYNCELVLPESGRPDRIRRSFFLL